MWVAAKGHGRHRVGRALGERSTKAGITGRGATFEGSAPPFR